MILVDDEHAMMDRKSFDALNDYSCSLPSGTTIGKQWKRRKNYRDASQGWMLGEYYDIDKPGSVGIRWREIIEVVP